MQHAGHQYGQGAANSHQSPPFVHTDIPSQQNSGGSSTSTLLRQYRKKDGSEKNSPTDLNNGENSHIARVPPHNHFPAGPNNYYERYHQFTDFNTTYKEPPAQVKYSEIAETATQPLQHVDHVPSNIQKHKDPHKEFLDMCNISQQAHMKQNYSENLSRQQSYTSDATSAHHQYLHKESQIHPTYKPESQYLSKEAQYQQYQQLTKYNMSTQCRKYPPPPPENDFLAKLQRIHPTMARSIMSDHHLRESQNYSAIDQSRMYQQNQRYYPAHLQSNPTYPNYHGIPQYNYPSSCNYKHPDYGRTNQMVRYPNVQERSISPRRTYSENIAMPINYGVPPQKISPNYPQYNTPEYAQHYQHRRAAVSQEYYQQPCRPNTYEISSQPTENREPSAIRHYLENWAEEEPPPEHGATIYKDTSRMHNEPENEQVFVINSTDLPPQCLENVSLVPTENGQFIIKSGALDNSVLRIKETTDNGERTVNLQIIEAPSKPDCVLEEKETEKVATPKITESETDTPQNVTEPLVEKPTVAADQITDNTVSVIKDMPLIEDEQAKLLRKIEEKDTVKLELPITSPVSTTKRTQRIFSVDDIMNNIGNSSQRRRNSLQITKDFASENSDCLLDQELVTPEEENEKETEVQYQRAISIEDDSVILEIGGALVQLNINQINGTKILSVVSLSESLVIDLNGNYQPEGDQEVDSNVDNEQVMEDEVCANEVVIGELIDNEDDVFLDLAMQVENDKKDMIEENKPKHTTESKETSEPQNETELYADKATAKKLTDDVENDQKTEVPNIARAIAEKINANASIESIMSPTKDHFDSKKESHNCDEPTKTNVASAEKPEGAIFHSLKKLKNTTNKAYADSTNGSICNVQPNISKEIASIAEAEESITNVSTTKLMDENTFDTKNQSDLVKVENNDQRTNGNVVSVAEAIINNFTIENKNSLKKYSSDSKGQSAIDMQPKIAKESAVVRKSIDHTPNRTSPKKYLSNSKDQSSDYKCIEKSTEAIPKLKVTLKIPNPEKMDGNFKAKKSSTTKVHAHNNKTKSETKTSARDKTKRRLGDMIQNPKKESVIKNESKKSRSSQEVDKKSVRRSVPKSPKIKKTNEVSTISPTNNKLLATDINNSKVKTVGLQVIKKPVEIPNSKVTSLANEKVLRSEDVTNERTTRVTENLEKIPVVTKSVETSSTDEILSQTEEVSAKSLQAIELLKESLTTLEEPSPVIFVKNEEIKILSKAAKKHYTDETEKVLKPAIEEKPKSEKLEDAVNKIKLLRDKQTPEKLMKKVTFNLEPKEDTISKARKDEMDRRRLSWEEYSNRKRKSSLSIDDLKMADDTVTSSNDLVGVVEQVEMSIENAIKDSETKSQMRLHSWEEENDEPRIEKCDSLSTNSRNSRCIIDVNEFNIKPIEESSTPSPVSSSQFTYHSEDDSLQTYKDVANSKLSSLNITIPKLTKPKQSEEATQSATDKVSVLFEKFLSKGTLNCHELEKVKKIIEFKRKIEEDLSKKQLTYEVQGHRDYNAKDLKLHFRKVPEKRKRKRFRNLYTDNTSDQSDSSDKPNVGDYSVFQRSSQGVPKLIIKRKPGLPQPFVKLERSQAAELLVKKRKLY